LSAHSRGLAVVVAAAIALGGCGSTDALHAPPPNPLEALIALRTFPVYWVGERFDGLVLGEVIRDPGGAISLAYGACISGGQYNCTPPLLVVTSPENSFLPHGSLPLSPRRVRGTTVYATVDGRIYEVPTADAVVAIYASSPKLAAAAVRALATLNQTVLPDDPLPPPTPSSRYATLPLPSQLVVVRPPGRGGGRPTRRRTPPAPRSSSG